MKKNIILLCSILSITLLYGCSSNINNKQAQETSSTQDSQTNQTNKDALTNAVKDVKKNVEDIQSDVRNTVIKNDTMAVSDAINRYIQLTGEVPIGDKSIAAENFMSKSKDTLYVLNLDQLNGKSKQLGNNETIDVDKKIHFTLPSTSYYKNAKTKNIEVDKDNAYIYVIDKELNIYCAKPVDGKFPDKLTKQGLQCNIYDLAHKKDFKGIVVPEL